VVLWHHAVGVATLLRLMLIGVVVLFLIHQQALIFLLSLAVVAAVKVLLVQLKVLVVVQVDTALLLEQLVVVAQLNQH
jgi:hypothetical protein